MTVYERAKPTESSIFVEESSSCYATKAEIVRLQSGDSKAETAKAANMAEVLLASKGIESPFGSADFLTIARASRHANRPIAVVISLNWKDMIKKPSWKAGGRWDAQYQLAGLEFINIKTKTLRVFRVYPNIDSKGNYYYEARCGNEVSIRNPAASMSEEMSVDWTDKTGRLKSLREAIRFICNNLFEKCIEEEMESYDKSVHFTDDDGKLITCK